MSMADSRVVLARDDRQSEAPAKADAHGGVIKIAIAVALALYLWRLIGPFTRFPGTRIDARFNQVVLEHLWDWASGRVGSLADPAFFYPYRSILFLSDTHFGSGAVYVLFRALGAPRELAFDLWFLVGMAATFAATAYVLRRFGLPTASALFGACVFTFSLPMLAQDAHAQLVYRFATPLAVLAAIEFRRAPGWRTLAPLALWVAWQFLCSIYIGVFLVELLAVGGAAALVLPFGPSKPSTMSRPVGAATVIGALIAVAAAVFLLSRHAEIAHAYAIRHDMSEIGAMAPRWTSLLAQEGAPSVGWLAALLPHHTVYWDWEHQLFPGLGVLALAGAGAWLSRGDPVNRRVVVVCLAAITGMWALNLDVGGFGLYRVLNALPGLNAIRSPGRVALVIAFPLAWLAALGVSALPRSGSLGALALLTLGVGLSVLDIATFRSASVDIAEARARITAISAGLDGEALRQKRAVLMRFGDDTSEQETMRDLDLMIAAQNIGVDTFNGYSGSTPPGWRRPRNCEEAQAWIAQADALPFKRAGADDLAARAVILPLGSCP